VNYIESHSDDVTEVGFLTVTRLKRPTDNTDPISPKQTPDSTFWFYRRSGQYLQYYNNR
jgi:hypothetical protein